MPNSFQLSERPSSDRVSSRSASSFFDRYVFTEIEAAIHDAGWDHLPITKFLITHGHIDHVGCGKYLVENYDVKTYLSKKDDALRLETLSEEGRSDSWKEFGIDCFLADG
ncbi:MAG: MBL fold metallo-hydrolase, partial [Lachnospiraceae bacterium]|nr:MBL fold metallo-hydrolase [Lachnospiraceae bacterium]